MKAGKRLAATLFAVGLMAAPSFADLLGPAEVPPASFTGPQYVDSKGCVFLRAGYGGREQWVPRVSQDRQQMCGYPPSTAAAASTLTAAPDAAIMPQPEAEPTKPVAAAPAAAETPAKPTVKPEVKAATSSSSRKSSKGKAPPRRAVIGGAVVAADGSGFALTCPKTAAVVQGIATADGGHTLLCTRGDGSLQGASPPRLEPHGEALADAGDLTVASGAAGASIKVVVRHRDGSTSARDGVVVATVANGKRVVKLLPDLAVVPSLATQDAPPVQTTKPQADPGIYISVGAFGVPANADGAAARLRGENLPVAYGRAGGGSLKVVYAGPYTSAQAADQALSVVRALGFTDALILR